MRIREKTFDLAVENTDTPPLRSASRVAFFLLDLCKSRARSACCKLTGDDGR
jgi:hypothetical protein